MYPQGRSSRFTDVSQVARNTPARKVMLLLACTLEGAYVREQHIGEGLVPNIAYRAIALQIWWRISWFANTSRIGFHGIP